MPYLTDVIRTLVTYDGTDQSWVDGQRVASLTLDEIINLDTAAFRAEHAAATIRDYEFRILPADDEALRYHLFRHRCNNVNDDPRSSAAYHIPILIQRPMADGLTFGEAIAAVEPPHHHTYETTVTGDINPVTNSGHRTTTQTCTTCGHTTTRTESRNWTGD